MALRVGINGFGRIGRLIARALFEYRIEDVELVLVNSPGALETSAHLLRYDSVHGRFGASVTTGPDWIDFGRGWTAISSRSSRGTTMSGVLRTA